MENNNFIPHNLIYIKHIYYKYIFWLFLVNDMQTPPHSSPPTSLKSSQIYTKNNLLKSFLKIFLGPKRCIMFWSEPCPNYDTGTSPPLKRGQIEFLVPKDAQCSETWGFTQLKILSFNYAQSLCFYLFYKLCQKIWVNIKTWYRKPDIFAWYQVTRYRAPSFRPTCFHPMHFRPIHFVQSF